MKYVNNTKQIIKATFTITSEYANNSCDLVISAKIRNATATIPNPTKILGIKSFYFLFSFICIS